jgi:hypothetical protein
VKERECERVMSPLDHVSCTCVCGRCLWYVPCVESGQESERAREQESKRARERESERAREQESERAREPESQGVMSPTQYVSVRVCVWYVCVMYVCGVCLWCVSVVLCVVSVCVDESIGTCTVLLSLVCSSIYCAATYIYYILYTIY